MDTKTADQPLFGLFVFIRGPKGFFGSRRQTHLPGRMTDESLYAKRPSNEAMHSRYDKLIQITPGYRRRTPLNKKHLAIGFVIACVATLSVLPALGQSAPVPTPKPAARTQSPD